MEEACKNGARTMQGGRKEHARSVEEACKDHVRMVQEAWKEHARSARLAQQPADRRHAAAESLGCPGAPSSWVHPRGCSPGRGGVWSPYAGMKADTQITPG